MTLPALAGTLALLAATLPAATLPAAAQTNGPVPGPYGAEDGYNDDGFGWGPAYRPETNFRPAYGFYGGVERAYPYGARPEPRATGSLGDPRQALAPRRVVRHRLVRRTGHVRRAAQVRPTSAATVR